MFSKTVPFFLHALSSVHAGSGSEIGIVDLPIQREKVTRYPKIEGSSLKGALRSAVREIHDVEGLRKDNFHLVFGSEAGDSDHMQASAISFSDARTFLFPVRSMHGTFAWITCPLVLDRFNQEMSVYMRQDPEPFTPLPVPASLSVASMETLTVKDQAIVLEEYQYTVKETDEAKQLAERLEGYLRNICQLGLTDRLVILDNDSFSEFVQLSTEVNARNHINDSGTTEAGALWYEENVPPETVFYSTLFIGNVRKNASSAKKSVGSDEAGAEEESNRPLRTADDVYRFMNSYFPRYFQLGGNYTLGRGLFETIALKEGENFGRG